MIAANELRIGNLITDCDGERFWVAKDIELNENGYWVGIDHNDCINIEGCYPIALTPAILEKAGFAVREDNPKDKPQYEGDVLVTIVGFEFTNSDKGQVNRGFYCYEINNGDTVINYVHQLQNLYRALTGEELNITF